MTLNSRNKAILAFSAGAAAVILFFGTAALIFLFKKTYMPLPSFSRSLPLPESFGLLSYQPAAALLALVMLLIYVPLAGFLTFASFEKTQAPEILFFTGFLIGCFLQGLRICVPLFHLWTGVSNFLVFTARSSFAGQLMCALSFFFASLFSSDEQIQSTDRNFYIMIGIAVVFAVFIPVNVLDLDTRFLPRFGFTLTTNTIHVILFLISGIVFYTNGKNRENGYYSAVFPAYLYLCGGYFLLVFTDNYIFLAAGTVLFAWGSSKYLKAVHRYYIWL